MKWTSWPKAASSMPSSVATTPLPGFTGESWLCLYAPSATPAALLDRLRALVRQAASSPEFVKSAAIGGFDVPELSPQEVDAFLKADAARWRDVEHAANINLE